MEEIRICSRCSASRPISDYRANQFGYRVRYCKTCHNRMNAEYARKNKEQAAARSAKWDQEHPERRSERLRKYKSINRDKINARRRALHKANPEQRNSAKRDWRAANRAEENRKAAESMRAWRALNKDRVRILNHIHRVRKTSNTPEHHTVEDVLNIMKAQRGRGSYCKRDIRKSYEIDHIIAIVAGGNNDRKNIQLTCQRCNRSKGKKDPIVFAQSLGRLI